MLSTMLSIKQEKVTHPGPSWLEQVGQRTCEWCSGPEGMKQELPYYVDKPLAEWPREWLLDLKYCDDCVVEYHRIKDDLLEWMPDYKLKLQKADIRRLTDSITEAIEKAIDRKPFAPSLQEDPDEIVTKLHVPLLEILRFPYLLHHEKLSLLFVQGLITLLQCGCPLMLEEKRPGVYLLLVHPDPEVRSWSVRQVRALGLINTDDYDLLQDVVSWLVSVVEFNLFDCSNFIAEENSDSTMLPLSFLPMHLFSHLTVRQYWLGLFIMLRQMDVPTVQTRFMGSTGHRNVLNTTVSVMENSSHHEEESAFWPTLQCLVVFLERLGSRIWLQFSSFKCSPDQLFSIITEHPLYRNAIKKWDSTGKIQEKGEESAVNLSQDVCVISSRRSSSSSDRNSCTGRLYKTTLAWFQPFVQSLLDFDSGGSCVSRVIEYLHNTAAGSSPGKPLWFEVQSALLPIIHELLRECIYPLLTPTVRLWVLDVVDVAFFADKTTGKVQSLVATTRRLLLQLLKLVHKLGHREALKYIPVYTTGKLSAGHKKHVISLVIQTLEAKDLQSDLRPLWKTSSRSADVVVNEDKRIEDKQKLKVFNQEKKEISPVKGETKSKRILDWIVEPLEDKDTSFDRDTLPSTSANHSHLARSHKFDTNISLHPLGKDEKTTESAVGSWGKPSTGHQASSAYESKLQSHGGEEEHWVKPKPVMKKRIEKPVHREAVKKLQTLLQPLVPLKDVIRSEGVSTTLLGKKSNHGGPKVKDGKAVVPPRIEKQSKATDHKATQEATIIHKQLIARKSAGRLMEPVALEGHGNTSEDPIVLSDDDDDNSDDDDEYGDDNDDMLSDAGSSEEARPQDAIVNNKQPTSTCTRKEEDLSYFDSSEEDDCENDLVQVLEDFESSQSESRDGNGYQFNSSESLTKSRNQKPAVVDMSVTRVMSSGDDESDNVNDNDDDDDDDDSELLSSIFADRNKTEFSSSGEFTRRNTEPHASVNSESKQSVSGLSTELKHSSEAVSDDLKEQLFDFREEPSFFNYLKDKEEKPNVNSNKLNFNLVETIHTDSNKEPVNLEESQLGETSLAGISDQLENHGTFDDGIHFWDDFPLDMMWSSQENALASVEEDLEDIYSVNTNSDNRSSPQPNDDNVAAEIDMEIDHDLNDQYHECRSSPQPYFDTSDVPVNKAPFSVEGSSKLTKKSKKSVTFQEPPDQGRIVEQGTKSMAPPQPAASTKPSRALTEDDFLHEILRWQVPVEQDNGKRGAMLQMLIERLKPVPYSFDSMDEYYDTFRPLLFAEIWEQMISGWSDKERNKKTVLVKVDAGCPTNNLWTVQCSGVIDKEQKDHAEFPMESDLVVVWLAIGKREGVDVYRPFPVFGVVKKTEAKPITTQKNSVGRDRQNDDANKGKFQLTLTIQTSLKFHPARQSRLKVDFVMSLLTSLRQWGGLMYFSKSLLACDLLRPRNSRNFGIDDFGLPLQGPVNWNPSQQRVISTAATAVHQPYPIPRICLVQGPPGTGKSLTIVGLVSKILNAKSSEGNQQPGVLSSKFRVLLCAPSNAAIDELIRKLAQANIRLDRQHDDKDYRRDSRQGVARKDSIKNCGDLCLVRVGRRSHIHPAVMKFSLENMTKEVLNNTGVAPAEAVTEIRERLKKIDEEEKNIEDQIFRMNASSLVPDQESVLKELEKKKKELTEIKRKLEKKRFTEKEGRQRQERRVRRSILADADIICTTLSGSGSSSLKQDLTGTAGNKFPFRCVIVDEACQSSELDLLIPLEFFSSKLVLVGDPEQLSATVKSAKAREKRLGRSTFERLYRFFRNHKEMGKPVLMLDEQYRMHPEIAAFPSQHVYNHRLKSDSSLENRPFPLKKHYALFNVVNGLEICQDPGALWNRAEADMVAALCLKLARVLLVDSIGVITPYRRQKTEIQRRLVDNGLTRVGNGTVEVNTVDGFQGREKDMIILSCVRAKSLGGSIGFVNDRQRMNVALTRARHALYIFGHMETLESGSKDWKALIRDADKRRCLYTARSSEDAQSVVFGNAPVEDRSPAKDPRLKAKVDQYEQHVRKESKDQPWAGTSRGGALHERSSGDVHVSTVQKIVGKPLEPQQSSTGSGDLESLSDDVSALESSRRRSGDKRSFPEPEENQAKREKLGKDEWGHHDRHVVNGEVHSNRSDARLAKTCEEGRSAAHRHLQWSGSEEPGTKKSGHHGTGHHENVNTTFLTSRRQETRHEVHHSSKMNSISSSAMPSAKTVPVHPKERSHARQEDFHHRKNTLLSSTNRELGPDERNRSSHDHRKERSWEGRVDRRGDKWRPHENFRETSSDRGANPSSGRVNLFASSAVQVHSKRPKLDKEESLESGQYCELTAANEGFDGDDHFAEDAVDSRTLSAIIKTRADYSASYFKQLHQMEQRAAGNSCMRLSTSPGVQPLASGDISFAVPHPNPAGSSAVLQRGDIEHRMLTIPRTVDRPLSSAESSTSGASRALDKTTSFDALSACPDPPSFFRRNRTSQNDLEPRAREAAELVRERHPPIKGPQLIDATSELVHRWKPHGGSRRRHAVVKDGDVHRLREKASTEIIGRKRPSSRGKSQSGIRQRIRNTWK